MMCDRCTRHASWVAFAAYDTGNPAGEDIHPRMARYPAPMVRACDQHLLLALSQDEADDPTTSTGQWLVKPVRL